MAALDPRRWDTDARRKGVGSARSHIPSIQQLAELASLADWVAEEPDAHLLAGLRNSAKDTGLTIGSVSVEPDGTFTVELVTGSKKSRRELRQAVWTLLGGVVEMTTHVREVRDGDAVRFEVVTGIPPGDGPFATHGHTLRLLITLP